MKNNYGKTPLNEAKKDEVVEYLQDVASGDVTVS